MVVGREVATIMVTAPTVRRVQGVRTEIRDDISDQMHNGIEYAI